MDDEYKEVLNFWFEDIEPKMWFTKDPNFDKTLLDKFGDLHTKISAGELKEWEFQAESALATIIVLDQFSRNMFRDTPNMFAYDKIALNIAKNSIDKGFDLEVKNGRNFFYLPLMHSEDIEDQNKCVELFTKMAKDNNEDIEKTTIWALKHREIIEKFNRFPHRNEVLGRTSTPQEIEFLKGPNSSF